MLNPIQVRSHWIKKLFFDPHELVDSPATGTNYTVNFTLHNTKIQEVEHHWMAMLHVDFGPGENQLTPYRGIVEFEGVFEVHKDFPSEKADDLVKMNSGAVLYAATRELILTLTSRSKYGPFELPTIDARAFIQKTSPPESHQLESKSVE